MKLKHLKAYLEQEESDASLDRDGFVSFLFTEGYLFQFKSDRDNCWYTGTLVQFWRDEDEDEDHIVLIVQLEGLPEDPFNLLVGHDDDIDVPVRVFNQIA